MACPEVLTPARRSADHGILLSTAGLLHRLTGEPKYLEAAAALLEAAAANLTSGDGALRDVQRGSRSQGVACNASDGHDPGSDVFSFKGIFAAHAAYFARFAGGNLTATMRAHLVRIIETSSDHAWERSATWPPFPKDDRCDMTGADDPGRTSRSGGRELTLRQGSSLSPLSPLAQAEPIPSLQELK